MAMEDEEAGAREERSGMRRRNGDAAYGKAGFGGLGGLHPWQLEVVGAGWSLGDRELQMRERKREKRKGRRRAARRVLIEVVAGID